MRVTLFLSLFLMSTAIDSIAAEGPAVAEANYDENKVGTFYLPDALTTLDGKGVGTTEDWRNVRRPEILELFRKEMYGRSPGRPHDLKFELTATKTNALDGLATRKIYHVYVPGKNWKGMDVLLYVPNKAAKPVPAFTGLSFGGNHAVTTEPDVPLAAGWVPNSGNIIKDNKANEASRGQEASRWAIKTILENGYALATAYYGDIEPDHREGWRDSVRSVFGDFALKPDQAPEGWGAVGAWAWGLSRIMDLLETLPEIDSKKVAVMGHSRLGKTSLWAGAQDQRFAIVISNDSGEGGAAIMRRNFGETVHRINTSFPHWFNGNFKNYNTNVNALPVDAHLLIALAAPRPVYIASAAEDLWADPKGEFLSGVHADPVYRLYRKVGLKETNPPPIDHPIGEFIGYHNRTGKHDVTDYDWEQYIKFANRHFNRGSIN